MHSGERNESGKPHHSLMKVTSDRHNKRRALNHMSFWQEQTASKIGNACDFSGDRVSYSIQFDSI